MTMTASTPAPAALPKGARSLSVDLLKLAMAVLVVFIHVNPLGDISGYVGQISGNGFYRLAVPAFFILGGYHFAPSVTSGRAWAYVRRMVWLYVLWTALYWYYWIDLIALERIVRNTLMMILGWWHLWYLIATAFAAAVVTLLAKRPTWQLLALAGVLFLIGVGMVYGLAFGLYKTEMIYPGPGYWLHRNGLFLGLPFFLLGFLIRRERWEHRFSARTLWFGVAIGTVAILLESDLLFRLSGGAISADNLLSPAILSTSLVLLALQGTKAAPDRWIGTLSGGLFFLHVAFVVPLLKLTDLPYTAVAALAIAGSALVTFILIRTGLDRRLL